MVNVCQKGSRLKCAGYCLYSTATVMVLTIGSGVFGFTLDPLVGEFVLTHPNMRIPEVRGTRGRGGGSARGTGPDRAVRGLAPMLRGWLCVRLLPWACGEARVRAPPRPCVAQSGKIYSFNEGNYAMWDADVRAYMDSLKDPKKWDGKPYSVRPGRGMGRGAGPGGGALA